MKIIFLGTNGWYNTPTGNTTCILIDCNECYIVIDAGEGLVKLDSYISQAKPIFIFITHLHLDHLTGFHAFSKFNFFQPIHIRGYTGTKNGLMSFLRPPFTGAITKSSMNIDLEDLPCGTHEIPFKVTLQLLKHSSPCVGYRFELENKIISVCIDTDQCEMIKTLVKDADVLITEASYQERQEKGGYPHLKPEIAAKLAKEAGAKMLFITHFDQVRFPTLASRQEIVPTIEKIYGPVVIATDGLEYVMR